jgi:hypothetical protein
MSSLFEIKFHLCNATEQLLAKEWQLLLSSFFSCFAAATACYPLSVK